MTLDSKQNHEFIEYVDRKIKSMTNKRHEIEVREKERPIHEIIFGALYERRIGKKVLNSIFLFKLITSCIQFTISLSKWKQKFY